MPTVPRSVGPVDAESKRLGRFYTPQRVVDLALALALPGGATERVWDPTCGDGAFLRRAALRLPEGSLVGSDLDGAALASLREALPAATIHHADLFALQPDALGSFDLILGNPPYLRSERVPAATRVRHQRVVQEALPIPLAAGIDVSLLALLHCTRFLAPGGRLAFVLPSTVLDLASGVGARAWLAERFHLRAVVDAVEDPWFIDASVNTVIVVLERAPPGTTTFARILGDTEATLAPSILSGAADPRLRSRRVAPASLLAPRWSPLLRAPAVWFEALARAPLPPLSASLKLRYGIKPGISAFFAPPSPPPVEDACLRPFLRSLKDVQSYRLDPSSVTDRVFVVTGAPPPQAAAWIAAGEASVTSRGTLYPLVPSVKLHRPWWRLPEPRSGPVLLPQFRAARHHIIENPALVPVNNSAWTGRWIDPADHGPGIALLNCSLLALAAEVLGRTNLGEGLLTLYGPELAALPLPAPVAFRGARPLLSAFAALRSRAVLPFDEEIARADRIALDAAALGPLGLADLAQPIREATVALMEGRASLARSRRAGYRLER